MIDPNTMTLTDWADSICNVLAFYGPVPRLDDPARWQDWGAQLVNLPSIRNADPADPYDFAVEDWREWATYFSDDLNR